jgi:hypothetical protein
MVANDGGLLQIGQKARSSLWCESQFFRRAFDRRRITRTPRLSWAHVLAIFTVFIVSRPAIAQEPSWRSLSRIAAGTLVENSDSQRWNRIVLLARPKLSSGDVERIPASIRSTVSTFILTILATVEPTTEEGTGETKYRLAELGVGYSMDVGGDLKVVTVANASDAGVSLGFISRQMLSENEKQLATARVIARTSTLAIFDSPAILFRDDSHKDFVIRHLVWIDSRTGSGSMLVWLLEQNGDDRLSVVADEPIRWLPPGMKEVRDIHVDGNEFSLLGIPSKRAFALEDLPSGKQVPWTQEALALAAQESFNQDSLRQLTGALNQALQVLKTAQPTARAANSNGQNPRQR